MPRNRTPRYRQPPKRNTTPLDKHARQGKLLRPPLMGLTKMVFQSWSNDRLPEMLWACLVISQLPRDTALGVFRACAKLGERYRVPEGTPDEDVPDLSGYSLGLSALAELPGSAIEDVVAIVAEVAGDAAPLRPLLLLPGLPALERWRAAVALEPDPATDWPTLATAVAETLDHQSQASTDIRWLRVMFLIVVGRIFFPAEYDIEPLRCYPHVGDMRMVRPEIRSLEIAFSSNANGTVVPTPWARDFWNDCLKATPCLAVPPEDDVRAVTEPDWSRAIQTLRDDLIGHWLSCLQGTAVDARSDAAFGFALYALGCVSEMAAGANRVGIAGRLLLRTLVECRISLAWIAKGDDLETWTRYRAYGSGQAKLALLKWQMVDDDQVSFVDPSVLQALANEDYWQEFVNIDLAHWCGKDLRKMSEEAGCKDDYDRYYGWTSSFVHGQWGAIRDSGFTLCANPLHRVHRIPLQMGRRLEDTLPDGLRLVNAILDTVNALFPGFSSRFPT